MYYPGGDLNPGLREHEAIVLATRLRCSVLLTLYDTLFRTFCCTALQVLVLSDTLSIIYRLAV
jgi:hypothetical protein